jgi:ParB family chromosome partitioning protein
MAVQKKFALGRGLDALISTNDEVKTSGSSSINEVELSKISVNPNQPRRTFAEADLSDLATSIRAKSRAGAGRLGAPRVLPRQDPD